MPVGTVAILRLGSAIDSDDLEFDLATAMAVMGRQLYEDDVKIEKALDIWIVAQDMAPMILNFHPTEFVNGGQVMEPRELVRRVELSRDASADIAVAGARSAMVVVACSHIAERRVWSCQYDSRGDLGPANRVAASNSQGNSDFR